jgi:hypothetical protein
MNNLSASKLFKKETKTKKLKEKKEDVKKWSSLCTNHQYLQIGCKFKWAKLEKP